jgi:hypothetical protein
MMKSWTPRPFRSYTLLTYAARFTERFPTEGDAAARQQAPEVAVRLPLLLTAIITAVCWASSAEAQTCDQTLSPGANVASAVSSASNGSTICLNSGNYGTVNFFDLSRTGFVTLQPSDGASVTISPQVGNSSWIRIVGVTIPYSAVNNNSHHIEFINCTFQPEGNGLVFNYETVPATSRNLLVDGCTFNAVRRALFEGRLSVRGVRGLQIRNSTFSGMSSAEGADGILIVGGARDIEIGPNNRFDSILQSQSPDGAHTDGIQDFGGGPNNWIHDNYFVTCSTPIMMPDGSTNLIVENNVFDGASDPNDYKIQLGSASSPVVRHNTFRNAGLAVDSKTGEPASTNALVENNIFVGNSPVKTSGGNGCSNCTFTHNLFDNDPFGSNTIIGTPTFVGGAVPNTYAGWALAPGSVGENAGNDGLDMGIVDDGDPQPAPPVITSPLTHTCTVGELCEYQIVATNNPTSYGASNEPSGWSINTLTGLISGWIAASGTFNVEISATNTDGTANKTLVLTVNGGTETGAPTFIQEAETSWNTTAASKTTPAFSVQAGDVLVAFGVTENHSTTISSVSGGSLTWTQRQVVAVTDYTWVGVWTAVVDVNKTMSVTFSRGGPGDGGAQLYGGNVLTFRNSSGIGASSKANVASGAPSLNLTTTQDNSAIVCVNGDWNALTSPRAWRTIDSITPSQANGLEVSYFANGTNYGVYSAYWPDAGAAAAKTCGLTAPSGQKYAIIAVEVLGTAGGVTIVGEEASLDATSDMVASGRL